MTNWKEIHSDFTPELQKKWEDKGFTYEKAKVWIDIGLGVDDAEFAGWLRKRNSSISRLREEYKNSLKLSSEVVEIIKNFPNYYIYYDDDYTVIKGIQKNPNLTTKQEWLINNLITNEELRERYKLYGLCPECQQPNNSSYKYEKYFWCQPCNSKHFQKNFDKLTSGNPEIDKLIQKSQIEATSLSKVLEWIPYDKLENIEFLGEGGFGKAHKANWLDGYIENWGIKHGKWKRSKDYLEAVVLKSLKKHKIWLKKFRKKLPIVCCLVLNVLLNVLELPTIPKKKVIW
ncbi:MAG: hypothetical protein I3273_06995 [Candidatus Moeniiplasma glomeromycotorum]|nr:hypothetical protein [Candidatus Moeniiplasma glomeromycotorum]MCE8168286.1 hypothetical protein [Candidatus Moeniiplasma glomeromycotorum]MCE8169833.1 hypothetical protein [Candidatus Moeniiplasma glomeromycotorum]